MIRINLLQTKRRKSSAVSSGDGEKRGAIVIFSWLALWGLGAAGCYFVLDGIEQETAQVEAETRKVRARIDEIKKKIDEEALIRLENRRKRMEAAIDKVKGQLRTPVYVMHEVANIMTTGRMPDVDEEQYRRCIADDVNCELDMGWDGSAMWISSITERAGNTLEFKGMARDPTDLSEFHKRLRVSSRFDDVSLAKYRVGDGGVSFELNARVVRWE
jgi:Tfp pilus assembly protein PilN